MYKQELLAWREVTKLGKGGGEGRQKRKRYCTTAQQENEYNQADIIQLGIEAHNYTLLDNICSSTVGVEKWLENYVNSLNQKDKGKIKQAVGQKTFKLGSGERLKSKGQYGLP